MLSALPEFWLSSDAVGVALASSALGLRLHACTARDEEVFKRETLLLGKHGFHLNNKHSSVCMCIKLMVQMVFFIPDLCLGRWNN